MAQNLLQFIPMLLNSMSPRAHKVSVLIITNGHQWSTYQYRSPVVTYTRRQSPRDKASSNIDYIIFFATIAWCYNIIMLSWPSDDNDHRQYIGCMFYKAFTLAAGNE